MVTDRCATTCLLLVLSFFYPHWLLLWQTLVALDISSHWIQMYMSLLHGETTHKVTDLAANPIMRLYYSRVRNISNTSVLNTGTKVCRSQWLEYCSFPPFCSRFSLRFVRAMSCSSQHCTSCISLLDT